MGSASSHTPAPSLPDFVVLVPAVQHALLTSGSGVEELDVGCCQHLGQQGGCHQGRVLHHNVVTLILKGHLHSTRQGHGTAFVS